MTLRPGNLHIDTPAQPPTHHRSQPSALTLVSTLVCTLIMTLTHCKADRDGQPGCRADPLAHLHRCSKTSMCAKMAVRSKRHGPAAHPRLAAAATSYSPAQLRQHSMLCRGSGLGGQGWVRANFRLG